MKGLIIAASVLTSVSAFDGLTRSVTVRSISQPSRQQKPNVLPIVEVVGCLSASTDNSWVLTNGSDPVVSQVPYTTTATLKEAQARPLGKRRYHLLGAAPFTPEAHKSQKVVVKGVLIEAPNDTRINVTSLQTARANCPGE